MGFSLLAFSFPLPSHREIVAAVAMTLVVAMARVLEEETGREKMVTSGQGQ